MSDHDADLPEEIARMLRDVPPADPADVDAHIAAALSAAGNGAGRGTVLRVDFRRRGLLAAAAAALLVLGAGTGWVARGGGDGQEDFRATATTDGTAEPAATSVPDKATTGTNGSFTTVPPCIAAMAPDAVYLGEHTGRPTDPVLLVFRESGLLVFVDRATCERVWVSAVTTVP